MSPGARRAVAVSLLLHVALLLALSFCGMQLYPQILNETLPAVWVTWADSSGPLEKKHEAANAVRKLPAAEAVTQKDIIKVQTPAEPHPDIASGGEVKTVVFQDVEQIKADAKTSSAVPAGLETGLSHQNRFDGQSVSAPTNIGLTVPTSMAKPRYRENAPPVYPPAARLYGQEGVVLICAEILPEGRTGVLKIKTSSGYALLDHSALETVRTWSFEPARRMGQPVAVWVDIPVRFVLKKSN